MRHRRHNGFTLIEITISLAILAVGLVALLALFVLSFDTASRAANLTNAAIYAKVRMEEIKLNGYSATPNGTTSGTFSGTIYSWQLVVADEAPAGYLKRVTLTVTWTQRGRPFDEDFVYYLANYAP